MGLFLIPVRHRGDVVGALEEFAPVVTCGFDPLRDEGVAYAERLEDAGVTVTHRNYDSMVHGFLSQLVEPELDPARDGVAAIGRDLQDAFDT